MMFRMAILASAAAVSAVTASTAATAQAAPAAAEAKVDGKAVVADVRKILAANYVLPATRPKLDAALAKGLADGRYDVTDPMVLAERINEDMKAVAHDKHLGISFNPAQSKELASRPAGAGADDAPATEAEIRQATQFNHGIVELKVLPGNIRYMNTRGFFWGGKKTAEAYDNAVRFLRDGDAVIIDMRRNGGGSPEAVQYLVSHFIEANRPLVTFYMRGEAGETLKSLASLPAGRMVGKPLYVLTSGNSASAAEEFIGHIGGYKLGELIGETSAGAGFRNEFFPVAGGYVISVSVGRAVLASTGKDWEGVGIAPTTKTDVGKALDVAQVHALRRLAAAATPDERRGLEAQAALLDAKANPVPTALPITNYAGSYDGGRSVTIEDGTLSYQRAGGPKVALIPVSANEFGFEEDPAARIQFAVAGDSVTALKLVRGDGSSVDAPRAN
jgi:rhodanese-related sulfurtransferase